MNCGGTISLIDGLNPGEDVVFYILDRYYNFYYEIMFFFPIDALSCLMEEILLNFISCGMVFDGGNFQCFHFLGYFHESEF